MNVVSKTRPAASPIDIDEPPAPQLPAVRTEAVHAASSDLALIAYPPSITKALASIQREIGAIQKAGHNRFHNYNYQKWDDVLNVLSPLIAEAGLVIVPTEVSRSLFENDVLLSVTYEFVITHEVGDVWPDRPRWSAIAKVRDNKGQVDDKAVNKCHTQAHKYFLLHLFNIRTKDAAETDSDADGPVNVRQDTTRTAAPAQPVEPHKLPSTGMSFEGWADSFLQAIAGARSVDDVDAWEECNETSLIKLDRGRPELREEVRRAVAEKLDALEGAAAPVRAAVDEDEPPAPAALPAERTSQLEAYLLAEIEKLPGMQRAAAWAKEADARIKSLSAPAQARIQLAFLQRQQEFNPPKSRRR